MPLKPRPKRPPFRRHRPSRRRHQIRAHLYSIGNQVLGDSFYGDAVKQAKFPRLMLHSWRLRFTDMAGKTMTLEVDPPADFMGALKVLR